MPLRDVQPLNEEQWAQVQEMLRVGPTEESIRVVKESLERSKRIRKVF